MTHWSSDTEKVHTLIWNARLGNFLFSRSFITGSEDTLHRLIAVPLQVQRKDGLKCVKYQLYVGNGSLIDGSIALLR